MRLNAGCEQLRSNIQLMGHTREKRYVLEFESEPLLLDHLFVLLGLNIADDFSRLEERIYPMLRTV